MIDPSPPLNIWLRSEEEIGRLISHFAHTPFVLDGVGFGSVEAFYTWLVCGDTKRGKVAPMWGPRAKHACPKILPASFDYHGREFVESSADHHDLILRANRAKLVAHPAIAQAFVATLPRPIVHEIPEKGAIDMRSFVT
jgi:hypothetical protein